ncbi:MAG: glycosyl hydrolase family 28 protein [archaeon]
MIKRGLQASLFLLIAFLLLHIVVAKDCRVQDFNSIQAAIDDCTSGGGDVIFEGGKTYTSGTIELKSDVNLRLNGATITTSSNPGDFYAVNAPLSTYSTFIDTKIGTKNVGIYGPGTFKKSSGHSFELTMIQFTGTETIRVKDIEINSLGTDSRAGAAGFHLIAKGMGDHISKDIVFENIVVRGHTDVVGTDGIDIQNAEDVVVRGCDVITGDDGLVVATPKGTTLKNVLFEDNDVSSQTAGIKFGTGSTGTMDGVTYRDIRIHDSKHGIRIVNREGGEMKNIILEDIEIQHGVIVAFTGYAKAYPEFSGGCYPESGYIKGDFLCDSGNGIGSIHDVTFRNFDIHSGGSSSHAGRSTINHINRLKLENIKFHSGSGSTPLIELRDICGLSISGFSSHLTGNPSQDLSIKSSVRNVVFDGSQPDCDGTNPPCDVGGPCSISGCPGVYNTNCYCVDNSDDNCPENEGGDPSGTPEDVNKDGAVSIKDLILVARNLGAIGVDPQFDVDGDRNVSIKDLILVARSLGT